MSTYRKRGASIYNAVPYSLPKFHDGKTPYIDFVCYDPVTDKMRRKKFHISGIKSKSARAARASELIALITARLRDGWNVWSEAVGSREYTLLSDATTYYKRYLERSSASGAMKPKTAYGYQSYLDIFLDWNAKRPLPAAYCYQLDTALLSDFLDHVFIDREASARTRNNYRTWLSTLCTFFLEKGYLRENPIDRIKTIREDEKKREALTTSELRTLQSHLQETNAHFLLACLMEYFTFIRPVELSKIRLSDIHIKEQKVFVSSTISKNRRDGTVGLNDTLIKLMIDLDIFSNPSHYYLFGRGFRPCAKQAESRIFREEWAKLRRVLKWDASKQFYSLKDSGIRDLANSEGIVIARDQARHSDISTTNKYLKGNALTVHEETKRFRGAF